jgi:formylglycine-generating enzyme required for sulfatase activity
MKQTILSIFLTVAAITSAQAQTLQVDPILERGSATFEIQNGTPGAKSILMVSTQGPGPISTNMGVDLDLTLPIQNLPMENVDALGFSYNTRSYAVPANVLIGRQIWFQGIQLDVRANPVFTVTNMVPITVTEVYNNPPLAVDDNASVDANSVVLIDVLSTDSDPDGDAISLVSLTAPTNGSAVIVSGQVEYTPLIGYSGADTFTYTIEDSFAAQATATVSVDVVPGTPTDMVAIPGGTFEMGDHAGVGDADERPVHSVTLDAFLMDKYEVSNTKFADFLNNTTVTVSGTSVYQVGGAGQRICLLWNGLNWDYNGSTFVIDAGKDNHPVVNVTWYGSALYSNYLSTLDGRTPCYDETSFDCDFTADGFRLPTEAEWEYASRGGEHSPYYQYPWGSDTITSLDANYDYNNITYTVDVGSYAANGYGLYDMAGNVNEWCNDWYDSRYYSTSPPTNPTGPATGSIRVLRGGGWYTSAIYLRCADRTTFWPTDSFNYFGFRVLAVQ